MRKLIRLALVAALLFAPTAALAQSQINAGSFWGNSTAVKAPPGPATASAMFDRALSSTRGTIIERGSGGWVAIVPSVTAGLAWVSQGTGADPIYGIVGLAGGGCAAALSASNGGILYSTASACAILAGNATARLPLLSGASTTPQWGAYTLPASVTSGGVACFTSTTVQSSSVLLTANAILLGGGAGVCPSPMGSLGTTATVLHGNAGGAPAFGAVALASDVTGQLLSGNLPSGVDANTLLTKTANYTIANTDCGDTIQAGTGASGLFTVTLPAVAGFASNCTVTVVNGDTGREKLLSGFPTGVQTTLWPLQTVQVKIVNGAWFATIIPGKWRPVSATVFNVSTTGTDATGCALGTGASACATGQFAMNLMCQNVDPSALPSTPSPQLTIQYATGAYSSANIISSFCDPGPIPFVGSTQNGWLKIAGNTNLTSVTLACGAGSCFSPVHSTAGWWIEGFSTTGTGYTVIADAGTHLYLGTNKFGTTGGSAGDVNAAYGSLVEFEANFTTTGNKNQFVSANQSGSRVIYKPVTVTLSSSTLTIPYTVSTGAIIIAGGATYSGTATVGAGNCYNASTAGGLETDGNLAALVTACGGSTGTVTSPGWAN